MRYSATPLNTTGMSIRSNHGTAFPKIGTLLYGKYAKGEEIWVETQTTSNSRIGDKWLHLLENDGVPTDAWVAIIHNGVEYCTLSDSGSNPPPSVSVVEIKSALVKYLGSDGLIHTEELFPQ